MKKLLNISAYRFMALDNLQDLQAAWRQQLQSLDIKGTILLTPEGVNMFLCGDNDHVESFLTYVETYPLFKGMFFKRSYGTTQAFNRMLVKIKKETIAFGKDGINPALNPAPSMTPATLRQWISQDKEFILLDTRNDYEVRIGTFKDAVHFNIDHFKKFPDAVRPLLEGHKKTPIVTFCTGGIRCEKAAPLMQNMGFEEVYQLEGGILNYFEQCGGDFYEGECFVFDKRVALDADLEETHRRQCYACRSPLRDEEVEDARYQEGISCPHCFGGRTEDRGAEAHV